MKSLRQLFLGIVSAFGSSVLVMAAILLSHAEGGMMAAPAQPTVPVNLTPILSMTDDLSVTATATRLQIITATNIPPVSCPPPAGWVPYTLEAGDTLDQLAALTNASAEQIQQANCLLSSSLLPGAILYIPMTLPTPSLAATALPSDTPQPENVPCGPPRGWIAYRIQSKDTLTRLSLNYGVSVSQLMAANCLTSSFIVTGTILYVPNVPTRTPELPATETPVPPTETDVVLPSSTFTPDLNTQTPTPTETLTGTLTETPTETPTETVVPSETSAPAVSTQETNEATLTPSPSPTLP